MICEPKPYSTEPDSHKFYERGFWYEAAVCIVKGHIIWVNGPFPCDSYPELKIFNSYLKSRLYDKRRHYVTVCMSVHSAVIVYPNMRLSFMLPCPVMKRWTSALNNTMFCLAKLSTILAYTCTTFTYCGQSDWIDDFRTHILSYIKLD